MKVLIIYYSVLHNNTEKVAMVIGEVLKAQLKKPQDIGIDMLFEYDLIGFGSGIYFFKHHARLLRFVDALPIFNKKAFIFSTSDLGTSGLFHRLLRKKLQERECGIIGEFACKGFNAYGPLKLIGGINKGRPNENDLENARDFAISLKDKT